MNTVNMPAFTAENSLYRTRVRYDMSSSPMSVAGIESGVVPAGEVTEICGPCRYGKQFCREIEVIRDCDLVNEHYECTYRLVTLSKGLRPCVPE